MSEAIGLTPLCKCGQAMMFPVGKTGARCPIDGCGMRWERGPEGYWATGLFTITFTPIITEQPKRKLNHYQKYMRWRDNTKGRRLNNDL
ncbi:hypothetical protein [Desulfosporosinus meridiei]|uniref:Uncharacterized protein n=1 Tax=Desulfosporosinus meridiei (strain ATCC BAA-275 / DSM 13257 / KCTC 12902 / NCIMB 13706 / S10) TaxID=768704 RepID=J7IX48_DESMD|nr:hypothetical protein [Desulfosporosinus meridiei]AFQ46290.1 hypothetical protein Desmer_4484 [Desulfosporosinus meridiei DSM 13257]